MSARSPLPAVLAAVVVAATVVVVAVVAMRTSPPRVPDRTSTSPAPARSLAPATSRFPAAGVCGPVDGAVLTVRIEPDAPMPRCASVRSDQWLRVVNGTDDYGRPGRTLTVTWVPGETFSLRPGQAKEVRRHFGSYLARGVHELSVGGGYRAEVWLR